LVVEEVVGGDPVVEEGPVVWYTKQVKTFHLERIPSSWAPTVGVVQLVVVSVEMEPPHQSFQKLP
jgi:hypothetical protein